MSIKVLLVDDSAVVRKVLTEMLGNATGIEIIGTAQDPIFAQARMKTEWPDVIVLDVEMPRMDGITFLKKIMSERPTPVVMCSTLTSEGSRKGMEALSAGAVDVVEKPKTNVKSQLPESSAKLIKAVRDAAKANVSRVRRKPLAAASLSVGKKNTADVMLSPSSNGPAGVAQVTDRLVAIGTSTGGTQALEDVLPVLMPDCPPILIVQHMPEKFTAAFASRLNSISKITVKEAEDGEELKIGHAYIAPGGRHLMLGKGSSGPVAIVKDGPAVSRHKPSADVLFRSVAKLCSGNSLGIIMTGMGDDGATGLLEMRKKGAFTLGQDKETCVVYGMPMVAFDRGAVSKQVPLHAIAQQISLYAAGRKLG